MREIRAAPQPILLAIAVAGTLLLVAGLVHELVRQLRRRRRLPAHRYRGPSVVLMVALAFCAVTIASVPFAGDAEALLGGGGEPSVLGSIVLLTSTQIALLVVAIAFVFAPRALAAVAARRRAWLPAVGAGVGWGVLAWFGVAAVGAVLVVIAQALDIPVLPSPAEQAVATVEPVIVIVAIVVLAPIAEELFFRGVAFNAWLRERGARFAYVGSAMLFAAIHVQLITLIPIFGLGLALAWVYRRTGTLLAPIAMHATFNAISLTLGLLVRYDVVGAPWAA